ncbi:hypothetical protein LguiB_021709 [Lonicera macranthoides]
MSEMHHGGGVDPSNLHLKKELTQIRKASRVLRDPGTTSSWRSPLSSSRSLAANGSASNHYYHHRRNESGGDQVLEESSAKITSKVENNSNGKENAKEKRVFLYNWRSTQKSESERSVGTLQQKGGVGGGGSVNGGSSSVLEESVDDSLSDARNNGDATAADRYASMIFKCKETNLAPSIRRTTKKKSKRNAQSAAVLKHHLQQLQQQVVLSRSTKRALDGLPSGLGQDDSVSLVDQSDDTGDYLNSEDLQHVSAASPLLSRLRSSKLLRNNRNSRKEDSSYSYSTPALSTSSFNRYGVRNPSTVGSWDGTTESFNDGDCDGEDQLDLPSGQGCGIPCYWSKRSTPKHRGMYRSGYSPSLSDTLRRKGSSILCGSRTMYHRRHSGSSLTPNKRRYASRTAQGLMPLLTSSADGRGGSSIGTRDSDDELSTNYGELDLEALSRLDGRRWSSSCRSQEGLELVALSGVGESMLRNIRSLTQKYRPMFFEELIGQNIVVQSLMNAIPRGRIAPIYLFQGPRGTGKTSTARIFAAALNCLATEESKPCGVCRECADFISGKSRDLCEVDGSNKKGIDKVKYLLKNMLEGSSSAFSRYKVFVIDECHLLPSKTWLTFLKFLEEPPPRVVFIFITTDLENVPRTMLSRCQKYLFNKIKDDDIVTRLRKIATDENLDVESDALDLIALNADGSLRDAETMLDQLSLLGKRITTSLVNELVGVVSDEKLLELLELAMSSDTAETVKRARELMDSGVDPMVLMSQLASLIMDFIAGTYHSVDARCNDTFLGGRSLTEAEVERLKHALKLLSESEKHLRVSSERSTWFTATLLQLGSVPSPDPTHSGSTRRQSSRTTEEDPTSTYREVISQKQRPDSHYVPRKSTSPTSLPVATHKNSKSQEGPFSLKDGVSFNSKPTQSRFMNGSGALSVSHDDFTVGNLTSRCVDPNALDEIWVRCIERCHSKTLRQLLHTYGKLVSISEVEGVFVAYIAFGNRDIKLRAERFLSSITNSFEIVLQRNIEVRIVLLTDGEVSMNSANQISLPDSLKPKQIDTSEEPVKVLIERNAQSNGSKERKSDNPVQRIESIIREQRLETAWLQVSEKGTPGSLSRLKPERNQVLPQDGTYHHSQMESMNSVNLDSKHWEDELNREINVLKINDGKVLQKEQIGKRVDHYPMSPSVLHDSSFVGNFSKESIGYESGSGAGGCSGLFCWNNTKHHKRGKIKPGTPVRPRKSAQFLWFGECAKSMRTENRFRR